MKRRRLFGTDGIRGVAGEFPLDAPAAHAAGAAIGRWARTMEQEPRVAAGIDTRESSPALAAQLAGGLAAEGVRTHFAGVITTPGIAYLTRTGTYVAGVMISASHNPYQDNGIKVFGHSGNKLPDEREREIEQDIFGLLERDSDPSPAELREDPSLDRLYLDYLISTFPRRLDGLEIVIDGANGAASRIGPELFERLGATVHRIHCEPDGRNINRDCGALHPEALSREVQARGADAGVALDGDGDRAMLVSRSGRVWNGDAILLVAARHLLKKGRLSDAGAQPSVVATVMSNLGLEQALARDGIRLARTAVGDKYVLEEMIRRGAKLGGEQSGHVIFREYSTAGDGLLTTLRILEAAQDSGRDLDGMAPDLVIYPQRLVNVRVRERAPLEDLDGVEAAIREARTAFGDSGRVLVRYSGTEALARVMVEGPDERKVEDFARRIAAEIQRSLGSEGASEGGAAKSSMSRSFPSNASGENGF